MDGVTESGDALDDLFRKVFRRQAATVTVLTYLDTDGRPCGMTATAVCSLSVAPPSLLACVSRTAKSREHIVGAGRFGVDILAFGQQEIANHCARPGEDKRLPAAWLIDGAGAPVTPVLRAALAHCDCDVVRVYEESTHSILIGHVRGIRLGGGATPMVYFDGRYCSLAEALETSYEAMWERFTAAYM